jgi:hypothetical protein
MPLPAVYRLEWVDSHSWPAYLETIRIPEEWYVPRATIFQVRTFARNTCRIAGIFV